MPLWLAAATVFLGNLPFGYWRANERKFTLRWALAIHIPVLLALLLRLALGIPLEPATLLLFVAAFSLGQTAGQKLRDALAALLPLPLSSCLVWDMWRLLLD